MNELSDFVTRAHQVTLLALAGPPAAGKSTLARNLLSKIQFTYLDTGECWAKLFPSPTYSEAESRAVFGFLTEKISETLSSKTSVIAEGIFASHERIIRLRDIAKQCSARFILVNLLVDSESAFARMHARDLTTGQRPVPPDAWFALESKLKKWRYEEHALRIDSTAAAPETIVAIVLEELSRNR